MLATSVPGLFYYENFLNETEILEIKSFLNNIVFEKIDKSSKNGREVAQFGFSYNYNRSGLSEAPAIPNILLEIIQKLKNIGISSQGTFDQVIINKYKPNQQIAKHIDHVKLFDNEIACVTIGYTREIVFENTYNGNDYSISPIEGSVYVMKDDARYKWKHGINKVSTKCSNAESSERCSITFRSIKK